MREQIVPCLLPSLPPNAWPEAENSQWNEVQHKFTHLSKKRRQHISNSYGSFISFLAENREISSGFCNNMATQDRVHCYIERLNQCGYRLTTIYCKIERLRQALRAMHPGEDFSFVTFLYKRKPSLRARPPRPPRQPQPLRSLANAPDNWPEVDRILWHQGLQPRDLLDNNTQFSLRRETTIAIIVAYDYWVKFLHLHDLLDSTVKPCSRVSPQTAREYLNMMLKAGISPITINSRFSRLRRALTIMEPGAVPKWLKRPNGRSLMSQLPRPKSRARPVIDSRILYEWGLEMSEASATVPGWRGLRTTLRDGLIIALFAARAPRLMSMSRLQIGTNLIRIGNTFRLVLEKDDLKAGAPVEYNVPDNLTTVLENYLSHRSSLVGEKTHKYLWINAQGDQLRRGTIQGIVRYRSKQRFGSSFGPHRFRHALGTSAVVHDPAHPGVASAIMNNTSRMVEKHYNLADAMCSAVRFQSSLSLLRARTASLAAREFRKRRASQR